MSYSVKEMYYTLQGEGMQAGRSAVFCRFTGCNLWSGREQDREKSAHKGMCAMWCDTDFRGTDGENGGKYTAQELYDKVCELGGFLDRWSQGGYSVGVGHHGRIRAVKGVVLVTVSAWAAAEGAGLETGDTHLAP